VALTVSVEVGVPFGGTETVPGLKASVKPEIGLADIITLPEKPFRLVIVIVEIPEALGKTLIEVGFAEMVKSGGGSTVTVRVVEWVSVPILPVTGT
jgi:hypothetical protein